jgi:hypothetical protein
MENALNSKKVLIKVGPPGNPYAKIIRKERRCGLRDRRSLSTYIDKDRRDGLSDRRKPIAHYLRRLRTEDRRQTHTYIADDRHSGIVDRKNLKRLVPPWWR